MKIAAFTTSGGIAGDNILKHLSANQVQISDVYVIRPKYKKRLHAFVRKIKTTGIIEAFKRVYQVLKKQSTIAVRPIEANYISVDDPYEENFLKILAAQEYDVFLSISDEIWLRKLFSIPKFGMLNAHPGKIPQYRGINSIEKMLLTHDKLVISGHLIDEGIDTGPVVFFHHFDKCEIMVGNKIDYSKLNLQQAICFLECLKIVKDKVYIDTFLEQSNLSSY